LTKHLLAKICKKCGKINSTACLRCEEIKKLLSPEEKKHDIIHHHKRKFLAPIEKEVIGWDLNADGEENLNETPLAKAMDSNIIADEVRKQFKDKHIFQNHEDGLWRMFSKFVDCWCIAKISKTNNYSKQNLQKIFHRRIKIFIEKNNFASMTGIITPDKFKKTLHL